MTRPLFERTSFFVEAALLGSLLVASGAPALASGEERAAATLAESARLAEGISSIWLEWGGELPTPAPGRDMTPPELGWALRGDAAGTLETEVARHVATRFFLWAEGQLPPVPEFMDAERPAPEEWAQRAIAGFVRDEAGALADALEAPKAKEARALVTAFTRARFRRIAALNAGQVANIRRDEQARGLAVYTAYQALLYGRHDSYQPGDEIRQVDPGFAYQVAPTVRAALIARLRAVASGKTGDYPPEVSGLAIALLLDKTKHDWRRDLQLKWKPLDALLATPVRPFGSKPATAEDVSGEN